MKKKYLGGFIALGILGVLSTSSCITLEDTEATTTIDSSIEETTNEVISDVQIEALRDFDYEVLEGRVIITGLKNNNLINVVIPDFVYAIGDEAFQDTDIRSVIIPSSIEQIGNCAFENSSLESVFIQGDIEEYLGYNIFSGCKNLIDVNILGLSYIGNSMFLDCTSLKTLTLPSSVQKIGENSFMGCTSLVDITLSLNLVSIDHSAFEYCTSLTDIVIPNSVESLGDSIFSSCSSLINVKLSSNIEKIPNFAFAFCYNLESIIIPANVKTISNLAFCDCHSLKSIDFSKCILSSIDYGAFKNCYSLVSLSVSVSKIGDDAFSNCISLENVLVIGLSSLGSGAFYGCSSLYVASFSGDYTEIKPKTFYNCTNLIHISFDANTLRKIGSSAFSNCYSLLMFEIKESVSAIDDNAFDSCYHLKLIVNESTTLTIEAQSDSNGGIGKYASTIITDLETQSKKILNDVDNYIYEIIDNKAYVVGYIGDDIDLTIKDTVELNNTEYIVAGIKDYAFYNNKNIRTLEIKEGVTSIGKKAFYDSSLVRVTIPSTIADVCDDAFQSCDKLVEVYNLTDVTTDLGSDALGAVSSNAIVVNYDINIESILYDKDGYLFMKNGDFYIMGYYGDDTDLVLPTSVTIENDVITSYNIYKYAFECNLNINSVIIPSSCNKILDNAFLNSKLISKITLEDGITNIGNYAFEGILMLKEITIPSSIKKVSPNAFQKCLNIRRLTIEEGVSVIGNNAFYGNTYLEEVYLPNSITYIGNYAFYKVYPDKVIYNGTIDELKKVFFSSNAFPSNIKITCTDGEIEYKLLVTE